MALRIVVGRDGELAELEGFVASVGGGGPARAVVVSGGAGIGKTTLWRAAVDAARDAGVRVLTARPVEAEAKLSFATIGDLLEPALDELLPSLAGPQRRGLEAALLLDEGEPAIDPRTTAVAVLNGLRALARGGPLIVAIDDVQWLDAASEAVLRFVVRRLDDVPIGLVVSERVDAPGPLPLGLDTALPEGRVGRVVIGGLSLGALHRLLHERFGDPVPRPVLVRLHEATQGNPFFALEIADELRRRGVPVAPGEPLPLPGSLEELLRVRVASLPEPTRRTLLAVASLSEPTGALVQAATGDGLWAKLGPAQDAGLVEFEGARIRFAHPLLAACVYQAASQDERRAVHARLSEIVPTREERARHLALAADGPDAAVADELDAAAALAARRGAPAVAAGLYEQAADATPSDDAPRRRRRLVTAAEQFRDGGMHVRARGLLEPLLPELPPGHDRARALFVLGWTAMSWADCDAHSLQALDEAGDDDDLRLRIHHWLGYVWIVRGDGWRAREHADRAVEIAERDREPVAMCRAVGLRMVVALLDGVPLTEPQFERPRAYEDAARDVSTFYTPSLARAALLMYRDRLDEARREFLAGRQVAADRGDEELVAVVTYHLGEVEWRAGRWDRAARHAADGYELMAALDSPFRQPQFLSLQGTIAAHRGEVDEARRLLGEAEAMTSLTGDVLHSIEATTWLGFLDLSLGDLDGAVRRLEPLPDRLAEMGSREPFHYHALPNLVEALVGLDRYAEAERWADLLHELAHPAGAPLALAKAARCRAHLRAARGDLDGALAHLDESLAHHERAPVPFERARTDLLLGSTLRRARRQAAAREALTRALDGFEQVGARLWAERARVERARIGGRRAGGATLTRSERELADLVAQGHSNREAAAALFVTTKTVETKLSRIYTKLGIRSRTQLSRWLADQVADGNV